jgi:LEA14-like dessication related protein
MTCKTSRATLALLIVIACVGAARAAESKQPQVLLKSISVSGVDLSKRSADLTLHLEVQNPGPEFTLKDMDYKLKLNGQEAARGRQQKDIKISAASTTSVDMPLTVDLAALPAVTWTAITDGFKLHYDLDAEFTVPVFALFNHRVKAAFGGDFTLGDALTSVKYKIWEFFSKP